MKIKIIKNDCICRTKRNYDCYKCHYQNVSFSGIMIEYFGGCVFESKFRRSPYKWKRKQKKDFIGKIIKLCIKKRL